jgi:putative phage-type endonuclease
MIILDVIQGTQEWHDARSGIPTSSEFSKIITPTGRRSGSLEGYAMSLAVEMISGEHDFFENYWMKRGKKLEPMARAKYEWETGNTVKEVGLCYKDEKKLFSCSPDGLVDDDGGAEIKCLKPEAHADILLTDKMPKTYYPQVQGSLYVTERDYWDFVSYCPGMKLFVQRIYPDIDYIEKLESLLAVTISKRDFFIDQFKE